MIFEAKGVDDNKKINGRKRQIMVDTQGLLWAVFIHAANLSDSVMGCHLLSKAKVHMHRLKRSWWTQDTGDCLQNWLQNIYR